MGSAKRTALIITSFILVIGAVLLFNSRRDADAQEKPKNDPRAVAEVIESGQYRRYDGNSFLVRAHRKSISTGEVVHFIEVWIQPAGNAKPEYFYILPESAVDFLSLHQKAVEKSRGLALGQGVEGARLEWTARGYLTCELALYSSWPLGDWKWHDDAIVFKSAPAAFEQALKDIETLRHNKPVTPW